ncbi:hypothetical protein [Ralstonia pickettii]|uniref:hypothetical protein n=1 Tax=Ralstonia pickettii TaxID=329 RepID=UPI002D77B21F|nr:hypothetical protein [Ralstonia pickettii]
MAPVVIPVAVAVLLGLIAGLRYKRARNARIDRALAELEAQLLIHRLARRASRSPQPGI